MWKHIEGLFLFENILKFRLQNQGLSVETYGRINFIKIFYISDLKNRLQMWKQVRG